MPNNALFLLAVSCLAADPSLTIYNQNFAVVREVIPIDLKAGMTAIRYFGVTNFLEPDSVILRDPAERATFRILEQNYRAEPVSEGLLLSLSEGKELDFEVTNPTTGEKRMVRGKVIRSGYVPTGPRNPYAQQIVQQQPIIEVDGKLSFALPGKPVFAALADNTILKPSLDWNIYSERAAKVNAEVSYMSGGLTWKADYNLVLPEKGEQLELAGWITMSNQSGKDFEKVRIKLVAGDVNKIAGTAGMERQQIYASSLGTGNAPPPTITERRFDEYHLYTLPLATTLYDRETKQVEFARAAKVPSQRLYVYDGARADPRYMAANQIHYRTQPEYGTTESSTKVAVYREFDNTKANGLGIALPKGRLRFYRRSDNGAVEFTGENNIDHTPQDEKVRAYTGDAFDLVGERKRTNFVADPSGRMVTETFEIRIRNRKAEAAEIRVVEHMFRWTNWQITTQTLPSRKTDSRTAEFTVATQPGQEVVLNYTVQYSW